MHNLLPSSAKTITSYTRPWSS